jgi:hypothetical protein
MSRLPGCRPSEAKWPHFESPTHLVLTLLDIGRLSPLFFSSRENPSERRRHSLGKVVSLTPVVVELPVVVGIWQDSARGLLRVFEFVVVKYGSVHVLDRRMNDESGVIFRTFPFEVVICPGLNISVVRPRVGDIPL